MTRESTSVMTSDEDAPTTAEEVIVLRLLGSLLKGEPSGEQLNQLVSSGIFFGEPVFANCDDVRRGWSLLAAWTENHASGVSDDERQALADEYFRVFLGVTTPLAPIWESVYFNDRGMTFQRQTLDVRSRYREHGLRLDKLNKEPDDNLGLELLFLSYLEEQAMEAASSGDSDRAARLIADRDEFIAEHTLCWIDAWSLQVSHFARGDFYLGLALVTKGVVHSIAEERGLRAKHVPISHNN